ncbi:hypothetical protein VB757_10520, partial [Synechococcus sp. BA-132 BA5]|nr:hypothetical protein [Synechococcus sp. BA-132 BA5]
MINLVPEQSDVIQGLRFQLPTQISNESPNFTKQVDSQQALKAILGDVPGPMQGGPISPDFALELLRILREESYDLIIEFGSGTSTLLILRALELFDSDRDDGTNDSPRLLTFEHSEINFQNTTELVSQCENRHQLGLIVNDLSPWSDSTGEYSYYSCIQSISDTLRSLNCELSQSDSPRTLRLLILINGPSESTGRWARYPAVPLVLNVCSSMDAAIDFLLDDVISEEGRELSVAWQDIFVLFGLDYQCEELGLGRAGLHFKLTSLASINTSQNRCNELLAVRCDQDAIASEALRLSQLFTELEVAEQHSWQELQQAQQARDQQDAQIKAFAAELETTKAERDALATDKEAAAKAAAELQQQLNHHTQALQQAHTARDQQDAQIKAFAAELETTKAERDALATDKEAAAKAAAELQQQ